jgi:hypothetical protein
MWYLLHVWWKIITHVGAWYICGMCYIILCGCNTRYSRLIHLFSEWYTEYWVIQIKHLNRHTTYLYPVYRAEHKHGDHELTASSVKPICVCNLRKYVECHFILYNEMRITLRSHSFSIYKWPFFWWYNCLWRNNGVVHDQSGMGWIPMRGERC